MTANDHRLDHTLFVGRSQVSLYRLARTKYANLSGIGAATYPGRWNRTGQEAIYTSTEVGVPVLERLVHTPKASIPANLSMMHLSLKGDWTFTASHETVQMEDQGSQGVIFLFNTLHAARAAFEDYAFFEEQPLAVAIPSVIVPVWNVVLYPAGRAFWNHVELLSLEQFAFDPRLFP